MAKLPIDINAASQVSQHLTDIVTKLSQIKGFEMVDVNIRLPRVDNVNEEINKLNNELEKSTRQAEKVGKVFKNLGGDIKTIVQHFSGMRKTLNENKQTIEDNEKAIFELAGTIEEYNKLTATEKERVAALTKANEKLRDVNEKLYEQSKPENEQSLIRSARNQRLKTSIIDLTTKGFAFLAKAGLTVVTTSFKLFEDTLLSVFRVNEKFTQAFGQMNLQIGAASPELNTFRSSAMELWGPLGNMGMDIGAVAGEVGGFASALGILDKSITGSTAKLILHGKVLGLSGAEMGEVSRNYLLMGMSGEDVSNTLDDLNKSSKTLGVSSAVLSKNVLVAGKNLLALAGPVFNKQMVNALKTVTALGISVASFERFTQMTDTFSQVTENVAKLNTVLGTNMNSLDIFGEQDPSKRLGMITASMKQMGYTIKDLRLNRQAKGLIGDALGLGPEEVNALLRSTTSIDGIGKAMQKAEKDKVRWQEGIDNAKTTLLNFQIFLDKVALGLGKVLEPFLVAAGFGRGFSSLAGMFEQLGSALSNKKKTGFFDLLSANNADGSISEFNKSLTSLGGVVSKTFKDFMKWVQTKEFRVWVNEVGKSMSGIFTSMKENGNLFIDTLKGIHKLIPYLIDAGKFLSDNWGKFLFAWGAFKAAGFIKEIGIAMAALSSLTGGGAVAIAGTGAAGAASAAAAGSITLATALLPAVIAGIAGLGIGTLIRMIPGFDESQQKTLDTILGDAGRKYAIQQRKAAQTEMDAGKVWVQGSGWKHKDTPEAQLAMSEGRITPSKDIMAAWNEPKKASASPTSPSPGPSNQPAPATNAPAYMLNRENASTQTQLILQVDGYKFFEAILKGTTNASAGPG